MPDLKLISPPPREELLRLLRPHLRLLLPGGRTVAAGILGEGARIDFVGVEPTGRPVIVLVGEHDEDLELVARGLAQAAWLEARLPDWLQLAPDLRLRTEAGVRIQLLCPGFRPEAIAAARAVGDGRIGLITYRWVQNGAGTEPLLEYLIDEDEPLAPAAPRAAPTAETPAPDCAEPVEPEPFRTRLGDRELGLSDDELSDLE